MVNSGREWDWMDKGGDERSDVKSKAKNKALRCVY